MSEIVNRVTRYLNSASHVLQLPIAEAMITYKEKRYSRYETLNLLILLTQMATFAVYSYLGTSACLVHRRKTQRMAQL